MITQSRSNGGARSWAAVVLAVTCSPGSALALVPQARTFIDAQAWRLIESQSGPDNYYRVLREGGESFIRAQYAPPMKTAVLGWQTPAPERKQFKKVRWSWRARTLPRGADECVKGKGDSAAVVYLTWKRGLRYYTLKYVWSATRPPGTICARKRNLFVAQDTIILESGPPLHAWRSVEIDLDTEFRSHFEAGNPQASVPNFVGIGLMSDGDQTHSESSADYGRFVLSG
jgi:hypothetical protein